MSDARRRSSPPPRYCRRPLPAYRFVPGRHPHPRRDPNGHSYGHAEPAPSPVSPDAWEQSEWYRYGVDLYNEGFWWEAHEVFEGLWNAAGRTTEAGQFFQALVHIAGASLKQEADNRSSAVKLAARGLQRLDRLPSPYMGVDVRGFAKAIREGFEQQPAEPPFLTLSLTNPPPADRG